MDATEFLKAIFEYAESGYTQIFALPSATARAVSVSDLLPVPAAIAAAGQQNIYFSPGLCAQAKNSKLSDADIIGIPALWADVDILGPAHAAQNLPRTVQEAYTLIPEVLPPSIIVHSGHGLQFWWLFRECWYFDVPEEKQRAQELLTRLQLHIRQRAQAAGWHMDATQDICRVMRLPGTLNVKIPSAPVPAQVIEACDIRYDPAEIDELLPALEQTAATTARLRQTAFERRPTDGPADYMLQNCIFMQHAQLNAKTISYNEWLAALTNIVRAVDGIQAAHAISALDPARYKQSDCDKKIDECLSQMNPQNCQYIQQQLGFQGCPPGGCGMAAPCGWSLGILPQARALVKSIAVPTPEVVYQPQVLGALAILEKEAPAEYEMFYQRLTGMVNKNTFRKELAKYKREKSGFTVIDGGGQPSQAPGDGRWLSQAVPDIPLNLKLPESGSNYTSWVFAPSGIKLRKVTDRGESYSEAAYTPVIITERIYNIDSGKEKARVEFKTHRGKWRSVVLPKSTIFDAKQIMCLADSGLTMNSEMAKNLTKWLSALEAANAQIIPDREGVSKMGWHGKDIFFPGAEGNLCLDTDEDGDMASAFVQSGSFETWKKIAKEVRQHPFARFMLAAAFATPLLKLLNHRTFMVYLWGTSGGGKTASLVWAMSVWGIPDRLMVSFAATKNGIERRTALTSDLPIGINERQATSGGKEKQEWLEGVIYLLGEGKGKLRATRTGVQKTATWRTIALATGEEPISRESSTQGVKTRVLEFNQYPFVSDELAKRLHTEGQNHCGYAGPEFVRRLIVETQQDVGWLKDAYKSLQSLLTQDFPEHFSVHIDAVACVVLADCLSSQWIFGIPKEQAEQEAYELAHTALRELPTKAQISDVERSLNFIRDWVNLNRNKFATEGKQIRIGEVYGFIKNELVCINQVILTKAMREAGFSPDKLLPEFADAGKIKCRKLKDGRRFTVQERFDDERLYVVAFLNLFG